jgi:thiamine-monophosphate kinase
MLQDKNPSKTDLSQLGEFGLIERLTKDIVIKQPSTIKGVGDDAAVMNYEGKNTLASTDLLVEGIHFDLAYFPLKHLGYKSAVVNFSDIYAMNGTATQLLVGLAVSNRFPLEAIEEIYEGLKLACQIYNVDLVGGDTTSSRSGLIIAPTALGTVGKGKEVYRNGAKVNDLIVVTGDLGAAYMGLLVLQRENETFKANPLHQPDLSPYTYVVERQLKPEARKDIPPLLEELKVKPTAMIDISDGLSSEILHITKQSGVGAHIYADKIPIDPQTILTAEEFNISELTAALNGGEDYELLFTISQKDYEKIQYRKEFAVIGHITEEPGAFLITQDNQKLALKAQGWNALKNSKQA